MIGKKMANVAAGVACGVWLALAFFVTPSYADSRGIATPPLDAEQIEQFLDELLNAIENDEFSDDELLDAAEESPVGTLIYELSEEDLLIMEFFINNALENGPVLLTPFLLPDRTYECISI